MATRLRRRAGSAIITRRVLMALLAAALLFTGPAVEANATFDRHMRHQVNLVRAPNVTYGPCVTRLARRWARHLAEVGGELVHRDQGVIQRRCNVRYAGQVLAGGYELPRVIVRAWMGSSGHRAVITNPVYRRIGVGTARDDQGRRIVVVNLVRH